MPKPSPSRFWQDLSTTDFAGLPRERAIAVLPVAAIEQHGPHLPLSVDTDLAHGIIDATLPHLSADSPALFLPVQAIGYSPEHTAFGGTLTLKAETVIRLWTDVAESVFASGVRKLLIFNTHGGNVGLLDVVARDLRTRLGMLVYTSSWFNLPLHTDKGEDVNTRFSAEEHRFGVHGGQVETAMMLALKPDRVDMGAAQDFHSTSKDRAARYPILGNGRSAKMAWAAQDYNPAGAMGNAALASAEDGRALIEAAGRGLARLLTEMDELPAPPLAAKAP